MKISEYIQKKVDAGLYPTYATKRKKLLWVDTKNYDAYCQAKNCQILRESDGKFWGYSDNSTLFLIFYERG